jgi:hypothetical protein
VSCGRHDRALLAWNVAMAAARASDLGTDRPKQVVREPLADGSIRVSARGAIESIAQDARDVDARSQRPSLTYVVPPS